MIDPTGTFSLSHEPLFGALEVEARESSQAGWDRYFLDMARFVASKSKDRATKVGAVLVASDHAVLSCGWNGFPRGVNDDVAARHERPAKYDWTVHAESNAITNAARRGIPLLGCTAYVTQMPCGTRCAGELVQAGVSRVVTIEPDWSDRHLCEAHRIQVSRAILGEGGVRLDFISMP